MITPQIIELWPDGVPNAIESNTEEHILMEGSRKISQVINPTIEIHLPSGDNSIGVGLLICPGGGYARLAYDKEGTDVAKFLNGRGMAAFVLKNRLPDEATNEIPHESPLMDAKRAMELIRDKSQNWNLNKIGVMGFSAGGHLASTLATKFDAKNRPDFMGLIYPVITMKKDYAHKGSRERLIGDDAPEDLEILYSNELQVKENTPPAFIIHSMDDDDVPVENSFQFASALRKKNVPVELHIYPEGGHGYGLGLSFKRLADWPILMTRWIGDLK